MADVSAFEEVNPAFGTGDPEEQILAVLDALHADGDLPVNGVDVEFVPASHSAIEGDAQLAVCQQFGQDDQVFAALAGRDFPNGAECMASRFNTPIISVNQAPEALYAQAGPNLFTVKPDETTILTAFGNWAVESGYLEGKTIGIYWETPAAGGGRRPQAGAQRTPASRSPPRCSPAAKASVPSRTRSPPSGSRPTASIWSSRSSAARASSTSPAAAAEQGYTPTYIDTDWASHLADVATAAYAPGQYTDVPALASVRAGDLSVGLSPEAEECLADYEAFSGKTIPRTTPEQSGEYTNILITCDLANLMVEATARSPPKVAPSVTQESYRAAIEQITDFHGAYWETVGFSADDHTGADTAREVRWNPDCPCWEPNGEWAPLR